LPVILAEGVENALSVWQATGQETWACLGVANIARAPVPEGTTVIIASDGDADDSKAGAKLRETAAALRQRGCQVAVARPPRGKDANDLLLEGGDDAVRALIAKASADDAGPTAWRAGLICTREGAPRVVLANAIQALRHAPEWRGVLAYDEFATSTVVRRPPPWACRTDRWVDTFWSDRDDYLVTQWLQQQGILVAASIAAQAVETVARDRTFHPVREYVDGLSLQSRRLNPSLSAALSPRSTRGFGRYDRVARDARAKLPLSSRRPPIHSS